jgi:hypothetical protein
MAYKTDITQERVNQLFSYDPKTGDLLRKTAHGKKLIGDIAWYEASGKSKRKRVKVDRYFLIASHLIYFMMTGEWPTHYIRHINKNNSDFRWENLKVQPDATPYVKKGRPGPETRVWTCEGCGIQEERTGWNDFSQRFCSVSCHRNHTTSINFSAWMKGDLTYSAHRPNRHMLIMRDTNKCKTCGISEWNGKSITFEVEHIDGNSENNHQSNLELICPNCHSQTDTYKGKNAGNGRYARRQRYAEGKSY